MTHCPSEEKLVLLLGDALSAAEQDAVVQHVEKCPICQKRLAHLSEPLPSDRKWNLVQSKPSEDAEEALLQRLKQARLLAMQSSSTAPTIGNVSQLELAAAPATDPQWPVVPGY